jgi:hypothetical protein
MGKPVSNGLMAFWTDIDDDYVLEFQRWHNCQHMTERTGTPGFHVGRRYRGNGKAPMFFISYETEAAGTFNSEPYLKKLNSPTDWTKEALMHFRNNIRNIYSLVEEIGDPAPTEAPYALVHRFNIKADALDETIKWYKEFLLPKLFALPEVFRIRFYQIDEVISNIMTSERAIYGGGPGEQKFMTFFELDSETLAQTAEWKQAWDSDNGKSMQSNLENLFEESSWLEFVMYNPD